MEVAKLLFRPGSKAIVNRNILNFRIFGQLQTSHVLLAGFHLVNTIFLHLLPLIGSQIAVNDKQVRTLDDRFRLGIQEFKALHGTVGTLVELSGQELHSEILQPFQRKFMEDLIGHRFGENHILCLREQVLFYVENVIHLQVTKVSDIKVKILIQSGFQAVSFDLKTGFLFYKDTSITHILMILKNGAKIRFFGLHG